MSSSLTGIATLALSSNGRTPDFDSAGAGSLKDLALRAGASPAGAAML